mgnify:CR=1 FL=1
MSDGFRIGELVKLKETGERGIVRTILEGTRGGWFGGGSPNSYSILMEGKVPGQEVLLREAALVRFNPLAGRSGGTYRLNSVADYRPRLLGLPGDNRLDTTDRTDTLRFTLLAPVPRTVATTRAGA